MKNNKKRFFVILVYIFLIVYITVMFIFEFYHLSEFEKSKQSGNERWLQVEERILTVENSIAELKKEVENGKFSTVNN